MHGIYRVESFEIISPYTLRIGFDDGSEQVINFEPVLTENCLARSMTWLFSIKSESILKFARWSGRTAVSLNRRHCTIGPR